MHKKKLLSTVLSAAMVSGLLPASAFAAGTYTAGTYAGSAVVYCDEDEDFDDYLITVGVTVDEAGIIEGVEITEYGDTYDSSNSKYVSNALNGKKNSGGVSAQLVGQSIETVLAMTDVDTVSGATCSSTAILEAVKAAAATVPTAESIDISALQTAITEAAAIENSNYTEDSWAAFSQALAEANDVIAAPESQDAVDTATTNLINAQSALTEKEAEKKATASVSVGDVTYYYADTAGDAANTIYTVSVTTGRGPSATTTVYEYTKADMTQAADTTVYYIAAPGSTALSGSLYGYNGGTATNYKTVYGQLGAAAEDPAYDLVSSATHFSGYHAKDISSVVTYGTDADGNKAITGLNLNRGIVSVDAVTYVDASVLRAAGYKLTEVQDAALAISLKKNPTAAPSEDIVAVSLSSATWTTSRYGIGEFAIVPDDTAADYVWSEYWDNLYAATISNGTTTVGAVHWIDLYGEAATSGPHYNKVELALNNGTSTASNEAEVSRYAAFFNKNNELKGGTYTITLYSEGYTPLTADVVVEGPEEEEFAIVSQPSDITALTGESASYSVNATEAESYQWYYSKDGKNWYKSTISGSNTDTISFKVSGTNLVNWYKCKVTGKDGTVLWSDTARNTVADTALAITAQPVNHDLETGKTATYTVQAVNAVSYQWYYSKDNGQHWYKTSLQSVENEEMTESSITMNASASNMNNVYRCKITGADGIVIRTETVGIANAPVITEQPADQTGKAGDSISYSVTAENAESYQWYYSKDGRKWYKSTLSTAATDTLSFKAAKANMGNLYKCKVTGKQGLVLWTKAVQMTISE